MKIRTFIFSLLFFCGGIFSRLSYAKQGLSTQFCDVILQNLVPGDIYNLRILKNVRYVIKNNSDSTQVCEVLVLPPGEKDLQEGYEPLPDVSWIKVVPDKFKLEPGENSSSDIIITIPADEKYRNRNFQAHLFTRTVPDAGAKGVALNVGLESRLRFSTGEAPMVVKEKLRKKALLSLDFDLTPLSLHVGEIPAGKKIRLIKEKLRSQLNVVNRSFQPVRLKFESVNPSSGNYGLLEGFAPAPDVNFLRFGKNPLEIKGNSIQPVDLIFDFPDDSSHYGKSYAFVVKATVDLLGVPVEVYSRIYVKVANPEERSR
jgi:hypothetical protein